MSRHWVCASLAVLALATPAAAQAPNRLDVVERVTAADPSRFACAHSGRSCEADWIKAVASALHATDARWGLNAKRDGPASDLSLDVVTFRLGPTDRHVQVFDICGACGSASARPVWNDITNHATIGQPGTARWVKPDAPAPQPTPTPTPAPAPSVDLSPVLAEIAALKAALLAEIAVLKANHDGIAAVATQARDFAEDAKTNASDLVHVHVPAILGKFTVPACYAGRQSGWAGGSIRLCPE